MNGVTIVWFRQDLRLADNAALRAAVERGGPVLPIYLWCPADEVEWPPGGASRWWLHQSLAALDADLHVLGSRLVIRSSRSTARRSRPGTPSAALELIRSLIRETGADAIFWNRRYEPAAIARDTAVKTAMLSDGVDAQSFNAALLFEPWTVANQEGKPLRVFTPFWRRCLASDAPAAPLSAPQRIPPPPQWPESARLDSLALEPKVDWAGGIRAAWRPGAGGAERELRRFLDEGAATYAADRDRPDRAGTSRLSPHLHFGEISPRQVWHAVRARGATDAPPAAKPQITAPRGSDLRDPQRGGEVYLREIGWREFAHHLLYHFPQTTREPLRPEFAGFPWRSDARSLQAWQRGRTGYPLVDAGMRELWATGWMHNRVRMAVASFLVKHLLLPWQSGAAWFWDTLVDADLANNTLGWQWTAGCGADAAPYFRILNPTLQGEKFDAEGGYVRRWVPELARLPAAVIHRPWEAPPLVLADAGVTLGKTYPAPIVEHAHARQRALDAFATIRGGGPT